MERKRNIIILLFLFLQLFSYAQDIHFSQFYHSPMQINPALAGIFNGYFRLNLNYKGQWSSIANPYSTMAASYDMPIAKNEKAGYLTAGVSFFKDRSGSSKMAVTQANAVLGYNLKVNESNNISIGMQGGYGQRSINLDNLKWDSQFDGDRYDPSAASGESAASMSAAFLDLGTGMYWRYFNSYNDLRVNTGIAVTHLNQPRNSYFGRAEEKLYMKTLAHLEVVLKVDGGLYVVPQLMYAMQGPAKELNLGTQLKYYIGNNDGSEKLFSERKLASHVMAGFFYRNNDAIILMAGIDYRKTLLFALSYDTNISRLRAASNLRGGLELSLIYKGVLGQNIFR
jgi:type IX secretion system PorP/SprF family membrane protein